MNGGKELFDAGLRRWAFAKARQVARQVAIVFSRSRRSERVVFLFLTYAAIVAAVDTVPRSIRVGTIGVNVALLVGYTLVVVSPAAGSRGLSIARDWLPFFPALLIYHEMGLLTAPQATHSLEARWVIWDHAILRGGAKAVIESLGPILPSILETSYLLVYAMGPFSVAMLYAYRRRDRVDRFLLLFLLAVFLCYAQFPFWPSQPPRTIFPSEDLPTYMTAIRRFNLWLLQKGGIHTSVFPSGHVAAASASAVGMWLCLPEHRWVGLLLSIATGLIAVATIYGRYHYTADAVAGLLVTAVAFLIASLIQD